MSYSNRSRYARSPSYSRYSRSVSRSLSPRYRSRSRSPDVENPGNNLYVTGLSPRVTRRDLEKHFSTKGKVIEVHLVVDPWTRESRGFGFVTMETVEEANRCIKYLDRSVLEGRVITVEKAKRRRGRTPTPGKYLGLRTVRVRRWTPSNSPRRSPIYSPYSRSRSRSPRYSSDRSRSRSYSPYYRRRRSYSPYYQQRRTYSPYRSHRRSYTRSLSPYERTPVRRRDRSYSPCDSRYHGGRSPVRRRDRSYSPYDSRYYGGRSPVKRRDRSYSPYEARYYSPDDRYYGRRRYRSISRSPTPRRLRSTRRSCSRSPSRSPRRSSRSRYSSSASPSPSRYRSYSRSPPPMRKKSSRSRDSRDSYSRRRSVSASSRSFSRSVTPRSTTPSN